MLITLPAYLVADGRGTKRLRPCCSITSSVFTTYVITLFFAYLPVML